jgi:hypothetical protein
MRRAREKAGPGDDHVYQESFMPPLDPIYETKQTKEI